MSPRTLRTRDRRYRRASTIVVYWRAQQLFARNYLYPLETPVTAQALEVLERLSLWTSPAALTAAQPALGPVADVALLLDVLATRHLVTRESDRAAAGLTGGWEAWHPEAAFFHFATKNGQFRTDRAALRAELIAKAAHSPPPAATKSVEGRATRLPAAARVGSLNRALATRRTWRRFGEAPISVGDLATLLHQTFGVRAWGDVPGQGRIVVKSSPSGGARHPIEAYVVALSVAGLPAGSVYHYDAARHELRRLAARVRRDDVAALLARQRHFSGAAALVALTPVFARTMWKYPTAHAYRIVLIEAGHLAQTFCLVAASLDLAPFTTGAIAEHKWDRILGLDGVAETPIYVAGVGSRPSDRLQAGWIGGGPGVDVRGRRPR